MDTSRYQLVDSLLWVRHSRRLASVPLCRPRQLDAQRFLSAQRYHLRRLHRHPPFTLDCCRPRRLPDHTATRLRRRGNYRTACRVAEVRFCPGGTADYLRNIFDGGAVVVRVLGALGSGSA